MSEVMHLMTIEMGAWCGASGPGNGRASSHWDDVTCPQCTAKGMTQLRALVRDMLDTMPASREALAFAVRAGRLGVTGPGGRPLEPACAGDGEAVQHGHAAPAAPAHVHDYDEEFDCRTCGRDLLAGGDDENAATPEAAAAAPVPEPEPGQADPFGGHEFGYESHTDLFRCVRCHIYEVTARAEGAIKPCAGEPPAGSGPIEVNAW